MVGGGLEEDRAGREGGPRVRLTGVGGFIVFFCELSLLFFFFSFGLFLFSLLLFWLLLFCNKVHHLRNTTHTQAEKTLNTSIRWGDRPIHVISVDTKKCVGKSYKII